MAENTKIEWCDHTFNSWEGCAKVSPGCKNCYAEAQHGLWYSALGKGDNPGTCWGINAPRLARSEANWQKPSKWNAAAAALGVRHRVFCSSMADVFEVQSAKSLSYANTTAEVPTGKDKTRTVRFVDIAAERLRLLRLIYDTPWLDWLLLTKRPENIMPALYSAYQASLPGNSESSALLYFSHWLGQWAEGKEAPKNVWLGTSVENQEQANLRIPHLLKATTIVRFISCEPLLSAVDLTRVDGNAGETNMCMVNALTGKQTDMGRPCRDVFHLNWVIVGGESGHHARPMHPDWANDIRIQCEEAQVPFLLKQWGNWRERVDLESDRWARPGNVFLDWDGKTVAAGSVAPDRVWFEFGSGCEATVAVMENVGKEAAGRLLNGKVYEQWPTAHITQ